MKFEVSVIIPVFNAEKFLVDSVLSALNQPEVVEVVLVEDCSPDNSLAVCQTLSKQYQKVKLYRHEGGINRGAGASRNLGIEMATAEFISFLDADDYFLPGRFRRTKQVFEQTPDADGVYEAVGIFSGSDDHYKLYSINKAVDPARLFHYLIRGTFGHFHTNAITIRKQLISRTGPFDTSLRLHQDSEQWLRLAYYGRLYAGTLTEPVTMVRRHGNNRITHADYHSVLKYWKVVSDRFVQQRIRRTDYALIVWKYCKARSKVNKTTILREFFYLLTEERRKTIKLLRG